MEIIQEPNLRHQRLASSLEPTGRSVREEDAIDEQVNPFHNPLIQDKPKSGGLDE